MEKGEQRPGKSPLYANANEVRAEWGFRGEVRANDLSITDVM
jgi:hypothetical protein